MTLWTPPGSFQLPAYPPEWRPCRLHETARPGGKWAPRPDGRLMRVRVLMAHPSRGPLREAVAVHLRMREAGRPLDPSKFAEYVDEVTGYWKELRELEGDARKAALSRLRDISKELTDRILSERALGGHNVAQLKELADRLTGEFEKRLMDEARGAAADAYELGRGPSEAAIEIMGADPIDEKEYAQVQGLSKELMEISEDFFADKIQGLADDVKRSISGEISLGALGAKNPLEVIKAIRDSLIGEDAPGRGGYVYRSQLIFRTELGRIFSASDDLFGRAMLASNPDMRKIWGTMGDERVRETHVEAGERYDEAGAIPLDEPFEVGEDLLMYPRDPSGSGAETIG